MGAERPVLTNHGIGMRFGRPDAISGGPHCGFSINGIDMLKTDIPEIDHASMNHELYLK